MVCNWYISGRRCKKPATKKAYVSYNPKKGEPVLFPICDACAKLAAAHWEQHDITAVIK